jgi:hypothetical protein
MEDPNNIDVPVVPAISFSSDDLEVFRILESGGGSYIIARFCLVAVAQLRKIPHEATGNDVAKGID